MNKLIQNANAEYESWMAHTAVDDEYYKELEELKDNTDERIDSFYTELGFGTSGMRGLLGPGTNRINGRVIRRATQGLANYLLEQESDPSVVIAYDSRKGSKDYAMETAAVLNGNGIKTYLFSELTPVPTLSFVIQRLHCTMGVMITASHNPKRYNGYKVYNSDGYQITGSVPKEILAHIKQVGYFDPNIRYEQEGIILCGSEWWDEFVRTVCALSTKALSQEDLNQLKTVYTPLNGAGMSLVKKVFRGIGYENYMVVHAQEFPDENFTTCPQPNPEKILAFNEAFHLMDEKGADLAIATDPDADRIGAALYHDGMRSLLSGNQLGLLIFDYLCQVRPPREGQFICKSIATTPLAEEIAKKYGLSVVNTLPGFKHIGEFVSNLEREGRGADFYYGFEESNGYLVDSFVHEKDGISGTMITVEMAAYLKKQGKDLIDRLQEIYQEYGHCLDKTRNYFFDGARGKMQMDALMNHFREHAIEEIGGFQVLEKIDYLKDTTLSKSNIVQFNLEDGSRLVIRPSGTEPKMKIYSFERGDISRVEKVLIQWMEQFKHLEV